ncbi:MAG: SOS response-associated peptidase [Flavobacteriaceae bacterium]|nr:SOS response-associated peptidase [Flavobacteriaceae bacterium]
MCFHSKQTKSAIEVENRFNAKIEDISLFQSSNLINAFEFPKTPVITNKNKTIIEHYQWGLIPYWAKNDEIKKFTLNAKIETLTEKPSFKNSVNKRCLVISDGFYEWQWLDSKGKIKQKYEITLPNNELFTFGGIYSEWLDKTTGEIINSYSIVTTQANKLMSKIHNTKKRMPVILTKENEYNWLNNSDLNEFKKIDIELKAKIKES